MRKFLLLMIALLAGVSGAMAASYSITYDTSNGTFYRNGAVSTDNWSSKWVSNESGKPVVTIETSVNNMNAANGRIAPQTYTITVEDGYIVTGFSMNCPTFSADITVTPAGESATSVSTGENIQLTSSASSFVFFATSGQGRIQAASSDGGSFIITVEDDPSYVDWTPSISNDAFVSVGEKVASITAATGAGDNDHWYILTQVRDGESPMYNVGTGSQLKRTATSITPASINGTQATSSLQYLVRFIEAGEGLYKMQFANGEFITSSLTTSASQGEAGTYAFYNSNGGSGSYFGWNLNSNTGSRVDNNGAGYTVAFWGSGTVSGSSGNNVWYVYSTEVAVPSTTYKFEISDATGVVYTSEDFAASAGDVISALPSSLQLPYCSYDVTPTTIVNGENTVPVTVTYALPFTVSTSFDEAVWYYATLRGKNLRADDNAKDTSGRYSTNSTNEKTDAYKWAFFGNPYAGVYVMNKNQGAGKYLYKETQLVFTSLDNPLGDDKALFAVSPNSNGGFSLRNIAGGANWYVNDAGAGGNLGFWNSASGANDAGSNWVVEAVPTEVTVTYDLYVGGEKVDTKDVIAAANSEVDIPASLIAGYSTLAYNITYTGTIGNDDCTIDVTATLKDGIVQPAELSNSKKYRLVCARGGLSTYYDEEESGSFLASPVKTDLGISAKEFAIINFESKYYLYSVSDEKFVTYQSETIAPLADIVTGTTDQIAFEEVSSAVYAIKFDNSASKYLNCSNSIYYPYGIAINTWGGGASKWDDGNQYVIEQVGDFDATTQLVALDDFFNGPTAFAAAIADLKAINWGLAANSGKPNYYNFIGTYAEEAGSEIGFIEALESAGYSKANLAIAQEILANGYALNMPATGKFYRIKGYSNNFITSNAAGSNASMNGTESANNIIYYSDSKNLVFFGSGYGLYNTSIVAPAGETLNAYTFSEGAQKSHYYIRSNASGIGTYCFDNTAHADVRLDRNTNPVTSGDFQTDWTLEEITTLPVTITGAGYATLYAPVALTIPSGITAYIASEDDGEKLHLETIEGIIPAETGVILAAKAGTYNFGITTGGSVEDGNLLTGTVAAIAKPEGAYYLSDGTEGIGFYKADEKGSQEITLAGFKAYLPAETAGGVKGFLGFDFGDAVGIKAVGNEQLNDKVIYNLAGQRLSRTQKGLNIVNGKKVLIK